MSSIDLTWAGGEHTFELKIAQLRALQQRCDAGPEWIMNRLNSGAWLVDDVIHTIRLGLEGGGVDKAEAAKLAAKHVEDRPIALSVITARLILMAALYGNDADDPVGEAQGAAMTADQPPPEENGSSAVSTETALSSD